MKITHSVITKLHTDIGKITISINKNGIKYIWQKHGKAKYITGYTHQQMIQELIALDSKRKLTKGLKQLKKCTP